MGRSGPSAPVRRVWNFQKEKKKITNTCAFVIYKYIISNKFGFVKFIFYRPAGRAADFVKLFHFAPQIQPREPRAQGGHWFKRCSAPAPLCTSGPKVRHISPQKACVFPRKKTVIHTDKRPQQRFFIRREQPPAVRPNRAIQPGRVGKN